MPISGFRQSMSRRPVLARRPQIPSQRPPPPELISSTLERTKVNEKYFVMNSSNRIFVQCHEQLVRIPDKVACKMALIEGMIEDLDFTDTFESVKLNLISIPAPSLLRLVDMYNDEPFGPFSHNEQKITGESLADKVEDICTAAFVQVPESDLEVLVCQFGKWIREKCSSSSDVLELLDLDNGELTEDEIFQTQYLLSRSGIFGPFVHEKDLEECCSEHGLLSNICSDLRCKIFENPWQDHRASCLATVHGTLALASLERLNRRSPLQKMNDDLLSLLIAFTGAR